MAEDSSSLTAEEFSSYPSPPPPSLMAEESKSTWSSLPFELTTAIFSYITHVSTFLHARFACKSWESAFPLSESRLPPQPPLLMLAFLPSTNTRPFYDLATGSCQQLPLQPNNPDQHCFGVSHGWLFLLAISPAVSLYNPFTREVIHLPPIDTIPSDLVSHQKALNAEYVIQLDLPAQKSGIPRKGLIRAAILSSDPASDPDFVAFVVIEAMVKRFFCCRKNDKVWTPAAVPHPLFACTDLAYSRVKRRIFAVNNTNSHLVTFDIGPLGAIAASAAEISNLPKSQATYLVETHNGGLLAITRHEKLNAISTRVWRFLVFFLDLSGGTAMTLKPTYVTSMPHHALFVGRGQTVCIDCRIFSEFKPNCIYFVHEYYKTVKDTRSIIGETVSRYSLGERKVEKTYDLDALGPPISYIFRMLAPARWVSPNLKKCEG
ncbi:uncharacterized protein [Typha latifolia]|uniref:uncharacterized protein n=1 Tax=Typha latifolia TaxID=4733 RepID=UPI003C2CEF4B